MSFPEGKKRVRFSPEDEIILLKGILSAKPFEDVGRWAAIQVVLKEKTRKKFTVRALRQHMVKKFIERDDSNKTK